MSYIKVSVIVPIYNSEKFLEDTINALINQTLDDIEIILINDGSNDNSHYICRKFENDNKNIKYIYKQNSGPSNTRNLGINLAKGEYIIFCDSDDIPSVNMYEELYRAALKNKSEIVMCDFFSERDQCDMGLPFKGKEIFDKEEIKNIIFPKMIGKEFEDSIESPFWGSVVRCLFKKDILIENKIRFPEDINFAEDLIFTLKFLSKTSSLSIVNKSLYFYRLNNQSLMMSHKNYQQDMFLKRKKIINYIKDNEIYLSNEKFYEKYLNVTFRAYIHECIGNACRNYKNSNFFIQLKEIESILNDSDVIESFKYYKTQKRSKKLVYKNIKQKKSLVLLIYYRIRFLTTR
ncbi:hypothetical protein ESP131_16450 [Exiguobacterium sp. U13-1]|uniref:glycosyltransferase n=1 Tax=Exiguobacterium sp. U13-1 TaxID=1849031 RepID=UPI00085927BC|nr:glycosyltransferase family 2 protein [Exiguobacterium sp. U13-1]AOT01788.1 hypothetical protein ESP131_16450 [Exiguobacterium sp. U13-1]